MKNKNIIWSIVSFILLFPFRLPINVILIKVLNTVAQLEGTVLPGGLLTTNVVVTKILYDLIFSILLFINIHKLLEKFNEKLHTKYSDDTIDKTGEVIFYIFAIGAPLVAYIAYDCTSTYSLSQYLLKLK